MGEAELNIDSGELIIRSVFYFYGDGANELLALQMAEDISTLWNKPEAAITIKKNHYAIRFEIEGIYEPGIAPEKVWYNDNPRFNFFRIEQFVTGNISFVDGIGCNTGYLKIENILQTTSTIAHEYGHTLGLVHPAVTDIRGGLDPCIMYPRGTLSDSGLQYDPLAQAATPGGTLDPKYRKVTLTDISNLHLHKLDFNESGIAKVGEFSSIYHEKHLEGFA